MTSSFCDFSVFRNRFPLQCRSGLVPDVDPLLRIVTNEVNEAILVINAYMHARQQRKGERGGGSNG